MAQGMLPSLFGVPPVDPELAAEEARAAALAKAGPFEAAAQTAYAGGAQAGRGLAQAIGGLTGRDTRSPHEKRTAAIEAAKAQITQLNLDPQSPDLVDNLYRAMVLSLQKNGLPGEAAALAAEWRTVPKRAERWSDPYDLNGAKVQRNLTTGEVKTAVTREPVVKPEKDWSEPYQLGGATVQKNVLTGEIRTAVAREPAAPGVTPVTIQDPNDPTGAGTIVVDARTQRPLGKGPKLTQAGTADAKLAAAQPQAKMRVDSILQNMTRLTNKLAELETDPGLSRITGSVMGRTPNLTNLATGAQAKLDSITSEFFVTTLQALREASKNGGAVGNVSDREGDKMERVVAALNQAQGTASFKNELRKARAQLKLSMDLIQRAYDEQFGSIKASGSIPSFATEAEAAAAGLAPGTRVKINGVTGTWGQ